MFDAMKRKLTPDKEADTSRNNNKMQRNEDSSESLQKMLYVRTESISRHLNRQMDFVYELLLSLFMIVMYVNHSCMGSTKSKHTIKIIIIYIILYDIYSILICQYHSYLMTLLTNFKLYYTQQIPFNDNIIYGMRHFS